MTFVPKTRFRRSSPGLVLYPPSPFWLSMLMVFQSSIYIYRWFMALRTWNNLVLYVYHESYLPVTSIFIAYPFFVYLYVSASLYRVPKVQLFVPGSWIQLLVVGGWAIHLENDGVRQLGWWTSWTSQLNGQISENMFQTTNQYQLYHIHIRCACSFPHMR